MYDEKINTWEILRYAFCGHKLKSRHSYTDKRIKKQIEYNNNSIEAVMRFPRTTIFKFIPYSKEELKEMLAEDPLLNNVDFEKPWALLIETDDFKRGKQEYADEERRHDRWSEQHEKYILNDMKMDFIRILKQAIRLYVNFSRFTLPNDQS